MVTNKEKCEKDQCSQLGKLRVHWHLTLPEKTLSSRIVPLSSFSLVPPFIVYLKQLRSN